MVAKLVFSLRLEKAVSGRALSMKLSSGAERASGTFAFYVKGRRASPPAEKGTLSPTSLIKAKKSQTLGPSESTNLPTNQGDQSKENQPNFQVLLVEDNLVNRGCLPSSFDQLVLTVDQRKFSANSYRKLGVLCMLQTTVKKL